jgi:hypothetical protein
MAGSRDPKSKLLLDAWHVDGVGPVSLVAPGRPTLEQVDELWPPLRLTTDLHQHWRWASICKGVTERFAAVDQEGNVLSLWSSAKPAVRIEGSRSYRLDYLEVNPAFRGGLMAPFTLALIGTRAVELGCEGLVLAAFPAVTGFYATFGGKEGALSGWKVAAGLVPIRFDGGALARFREVTDAASQEDD